MDAIAAFADHVVRTGFQDLPGAPSRPPRPSSSTRSASGLRAVPAPWRASLPRRRRRGGMEGRRASGATASVCRRRRPPCAMPIRSHNSEFDCVHEEAVVHAMSAVLPVALAGAERMTGRRRPGAHCGRGARRRCGRRSGRCRLDGVALLPAGDGGHVWRHRGARQAHGSRSAGHGQCILDRLWPVLRHHAGAQRGLDAARHADGLQCPQCRGRLRSWPREGSTGRRMCWKARSAISS